MSSIGLVSTLGNDERYRRAFGLLCILVAAVSFGSLGTTMTMAARVGITPLSFTFVRATGGAIVLLLLATARHERFSLPGGERLAFAILVCVSAVVSISLNAAYAIFCDRLLRMTQYQVPYAASGFKGFCEALMRIFDEMPADPSSDRALVDRWAKEIGLDGKYKWAPLPASNTMGS